MNGEGLIQPEQPEFPMDKLPKVDEPKDEQPKDEQPKVEQPKTEQPKVEEPKVEQPKVEQPKVEQPEVDEPKVEQPGKDPGKDSGKDPGQELDKEPGQAGNQDVKPVVPAPSYQVPAVLSQAKQEAEQKTLPNTGSQISLLALLGYGFLAGLGIILKKKEG